MNGPGGSKVYKGVSLEEDVWGQKRGSEPVSEPATAESDAAHIGERPRKTAA